MQQTTIRRAVAGDAGAVRALTREAYAKWVPLIGREPKPMTADHLHAVQAHLVDLLLVGDALAALIEMIPHGDHLLIENLAVAPAFQGRGLGRHLMAHAERTAADRGYAVIRLYTNKRFAENLRFYAALGFREEREENFPGGTAVHMAKGLRA
jgi:ribosomal protein S18 acetylase RimI-like enzyme